MNTDKRSLFLEISHTFLGKAFIDEFSHLIDDYAILPVVNIPYLENNIFKVLSIGCKTSEFNNLIDCVSCIEEIRIDNFFYIHCIIKRHNKVRLKYIDVSLEVKIPGLMSVRTQRLRDKKINEILE